MARERLSGGSTSSFQNIPPASPLRASTKHNSMSRLPVKTKRPILGERVENSEPHPTPRQHLVKPVKAVARVRLSASTSKASPQLSRQSAISFSPTASQTSTPLGANISRPGHTPHPRRSSVGLGELLNGDDSMLMDMTGRDFLVSDSEISETDDEAQRGAGPSGRGVMGAGRLLTPENSQETVRTHNSVCYH